MVTFIKVDNMILECSVKNNIVIVRIGTSDLGPFYRTYQTDYLTIDCLINELLSYTNDIIISNDIYDVLEDL